MAETVNHNLLLPSNILDYIENPTFKHYSFDFWNTIAFSNIEFKKKRTELILDSINNNVSNINITECFEKIGAWYNIQQESNMEIISSFNLLKKVIHVLNPQVNEVDLIKLHNGIDSLFLKYPPYLVNNLNTIINNIQDLGKTCSITSNTAFISGKIIREFLHNVQILNKFSFVLFSNELGFSKPSYKMFDYLFLKAKNIHPKLKKSEIIHIGDNEISDNNGAINFGIKSYPIKEHLTLLNKRYALHSICDTSIIPFNPIEYSRFKFGDYQIAARYGNELFDYFKVTMLQILLQKYDSILIYSSPYTLIPTSSYYLTQSFYSSLSNYLNESQTYKVTIKNCKIKRCQTYTEDYGALNAEERYNLIKNDTYKFVDLPSNKDVCIFIDDISITGTHQRVIEKLLKECKIKTNCIFLYYAKLSNPDICATFENKLNYSFVNNLPRLIDVIISDSYKITTRTTKYILSLKIHDLDFLIDIIKKEDKYSILNDIIKLSEANKYDKIELYKNNLIYLKQKHATINPTDY